MKTKSDGARVVESEETTFESLLISHLKLMLCRVGDDALNWSAGLPAAALLLNQQPFIFFNGRTCSLLLPASQFDLLSVILNCAFFWSFTLLLKGFFC